MNTLFQANTQVETYGVPSAVTHGNPAQASECDIPNLQSRVTLLANSISDETVRLAVRKVLAEIVFLLDYLSLVEAAPHEPCRLVERLSILETVRSEASSLVEFIENNALKQSGLDASVREAFDGVAYAIKHEVRRIFEFELAQTNFKQDDQTVRGILLYAQGVLTNCFQQCMITLASVFDNGVTADRLFLDWRVRRERSLRLYRDLEALTLILKEPDKLPLAQIAIELEAFREGSMQWLMYKDWQDYEAQAVPAIDAINRGENPADLLHTLGCYLETLLAHVKTRAVLADLVFEPRRSYEALTVA